MATTVYTEEDVTLQDDTEVNIRPLVVARLRRFMKEWKKIEEAEDEDESFAVFINCSGIALEHAFKEKFDETQATPEDKKKNKEAVLSTEYKDYLESVLDMDTIYKILEVCAGLKMTDPNLLAAAARAAEVGTN